MRRPVLPPGRCLTDIWPHLTPAQRRPWLRVVEVEARQVRAEVQRARYGVRPVTAVQQQRRDDLLAALYRSRTLTPPPSE